MRYLIILEHTPSFLISKKLNKFNGKRETYSTKILLKETKALLQSLNLDMKRNFDLYEDGPVLADFLNLQIYVYEKKGNKKIYQYPQDRDLGRPTVLLYYEPGKSSSSMGHIGLILAKSFFNGHFQCPYCNKNVGYREKLHYCQNTCYACKGFKVSTNEPVHVNNVSERGLCVTENK